MPRVWVGILGITAADAPSPGLIVARALRRQRDLPVHLVALATHPTAQMVHAIHEVDEVIQVPPPHQAPADFLGALRGMVRRERAAVLFPGLPADVAALVRLQGGLRSAGVTALLPHPASLPFPSVAGLDRRVRRPLSRVVYPAMAQSAVQATWKYPVIVRGPEGSATPAGTPAELESALRMSWTGGGPAMIQETVTGVEVRVAALGGPRGKVVSVVAAGQMGRTENGAIWTAVTTTDPTVLGASRRVLAHLKWRGPVELIFIVDASGRPYFTGIEAGFPSWLSLAVAAGHDLPTQYLRLALGRPLVPAHNVTEPLMLARVAVDRTTDIHALARIMVRRGAQS